ncbi:MULTISPECIES: Lrp/AsnC family transcriptional regulator [unclassified Sphingobium]|uniref:Lrp/AsnC family transcriptional regulator n=1 Tax=unclassified Sphingobium TaxID=2611147 RepID=UPI0007702813|nr:MULTISPECIES: Lrp/AsnC family transcriptional regulator [Sphingomonadaceae]AMK22400.1 AsnC family transcriptional regulator [Sphingobium sp. TKS]NML90050.1 Lrp/AsnC family transcriptional regulator [Sphingobium sp. TB-6]
MAESLDAVDRSIIRLLRLNARRPNSEIAAEIGLSPSACHRRIRLLEDAGVIRGYTIVTAPMEKEGRAVDVLVQVTLDRQTEDYLARFEHAVRQCPEIRECFLMTGGVDYWLRVETESVAAYEAIHSEILSRMPGVTRINSSIAMRDALRPRKAGRR